MVNVQAATGSVTEQSSSYFADYDVVILTGVGLRDMVDARNKLWQRTAYLPAHGFHQSSLSPFLYACM
jgi:hypothetical protein